MQSKQPTEKSAQQNKSTSQKINVDDIDMALCRAQAVIDLSIESMSDLDVQVEISNKTLTNALWNIEGQLGQIEALLHPKYFVGKTS